MISRRVFHSFGVLGVPICLLGCVSFGGRGTLPEDVSTLAIPMLVNRSLEPGIEEPATSALVERFLSDGRLRLVPVAAADLVLSGTLTRYELLGAAYDREERITSSTVRVTLECSLYDRIRREYLFRNVPFDSSGTYYQEIEPGARRARDVYVRLANSVVDRVIEDW